MTRLLVASFVFVLSIFMVSTRSRAQSVVSSPTGNLLPNSSFEQRSGQPKDGEPWGKGYLDGVARSPFAHWGYSGFWDGGDYDIKLGKGHSGNSCARLVCRQKGRGGIVSEPVRAIAGSKLQFKGWFKAIGASRGACVVNLEGEPGDGFASLPLPAQSDYDWTEVVGTISVPVPKSKRAGDLVDVLVFIYIRSFGELWVDDVTLVPVQ